MRPRENWVDGKDQEAENFHVVYWKDEVVPRRAMVESQREFPPRLAHKVKREGNKNPAASSLKNRIDRAV